MAQFFLPALEPLVTSGPRQANVPQLKLQDVGEFGSKAQDIGLQQKILLMTWYFADFQVPIENMFPAQVLVGSQSGQLFAGAKEDNPAPVGTRNPGFEGFFMYLAKSLQDVLHGQLRGIQVFAASQAPYSDGDARTHDTRYVTKLIHDVALIAI